MFRALAILVVAFIVIFIVAWFVRRAMRPALRRRHLAELEAESRQWDEYVRRQTTKEGRE